MGQAGFERLCGLANAVCGVTRDGDAMLAATDEAENLPDWLRRSWRHYWGEGTKHHCQTSMLFPPLDISVIKDARAWAEKLDGQVLWPHHPP
ncbi:MAG: hypothetical protein CM15mP46_1960 [Alphaproteobacteria bacterium]|nr:MAG: hypothetical protein CM15mP46_1960 [Alphaproteobacteria bacterium]